MQPPCATHRLAVGQQQERLLLLLLPLPLPLLPLHVAQQQLLHPLLDRCRHAAGCSVQRAPPGLNWLSLVAWLCSPEHAAVAVAAAASVLALIPAPRRWQKPALLLPHEGRVGSLRRQQWLLTPGDHSGSRQQQCWRHHPRPTHLKSIMSASSYASVHNL